MYCAAPPREVPRVPGGRLGARSRPARVRCAVRWGLPLCAALTLATLTGEPGVAVGALTPKVDVSHVTATAARSGGDSAISLSLTNNSGQALSLLSVTSSVAVSSMIDYDTNMCQGNHAMAVLPNILVIAGQTQLLGTKNQGAMLAGVRRALKIGDTIPIVLKWTNFHSVVTKTIMATVVAAPKGLKFVMASMGGMKM